MDEFFEIATIVLGTIATVGAFSISFYFARSPAGIARAVALDKAAEGVNMLVILTFATSYYMGWFEVMPVAMAVTLRLMAISATIISTVHLFFQTRKLIRDSKNGPGN